MRYEQAPQSGVAEDDSLIGVPGQAGRLTLVSKAYLMHGRPFLQGIAACHDIVIAIAAGAATGRRRLAAAA